MVNKKKGDYNFIFVIGILAALILVGAILYIAPRYNSQVIFNMNIDNSSKLMNDSYSVYITNDDDFGNVYYFKGTDYLKLNEKINATHGFSVSAFTFVADNKSRNNLGIVSTSNLNSIAPLSISPKPDTIIRVTLYFEALDNKISLPQPKIMPIKRQGFTVVEWGGIFKRDKNHNFSCLQ